MGFMSRDQQAYCHCTEAKVGTAEVAAAFDGFAARYAVEYAAHGKPCVVTLDRAPWHTSRAFLDHADRWAACGVIVHYWPPYYPELNLIEILWRNIKHDGLPLSCYTSYANLKDAVLEVLGGFGSKYQISFV